VLQLEKKHGKEKMEKAANICLKYDFISYNKLVNLINLDMKEMEEELPDQPLPKNHGNLRGKTYYQ
jgi:hypothetical protein